MQKRLQLLIAMLVLVVSVAMAQVTTSGISGKVTSQGEEVIGATVTATHQPSGTVYRAVPTWMVVSQSRVCVLEVLTK